MKKYLSLLFFLFLSIQMQAQWMKQISGTSEYLFGVHFNDGLIGYVSGMNGTILKTTNVGQLGIHKSVAFPVSLILYILPARIQVLSWANLVTFSKPPMVD